MACHQSWQCCRSLSPLKMKANNWFRDNVMLSEFTKLYQGAVQHVQHAYNSQSNICIYISLLLHTNFQGLLQAETPQDQHYAIREEVIWRVDQLVRSGLLAFKGMHVEHYGSFTSGLFNPSGDLDIAIEGRLEFDTTKRQVHLQLGSQYQKHTSESSSKILSKVCMKNLQPASWFKASFARNDLTVSLSSNGDWDLKSLLKGCIK